MKEKIDADKAKNRERRYLAHVGWERKGEDIPEVQDDVSGVPLSQS